MAPYVSRASKHEAKRPIAGDSGLCISFLILVVKSTLLKQRADDTPGYADFSRSLPEPPTFGLTEWERAPTYQHYLAPCSSFAGLSAPDVGFVGL